MLGSFSPAADLMEEDHHVPEGFLAALKKAGGTLALILQTRLELFALELEEEKQRLLVTLLWGGLALASALLAMVLLTLAIVAAFPPQAWPYVLGGLGLVYLGVAGGVIWVLRKKLQQRPRPFGSTLDELKKDVDRVRQPRS